MWLFIQKSGELIAPDGEVFSGCYAGFGVGKNNPIMDDVKNVGPIPRGRWMVGPPINLNGGSHGPYVLRLTPKPSTNTKGRSGFLMHGDSIQSPGSASNGCIVMARKIRERVADSGDPDLLVLAQREDIPHEAIFFSTREGRRSSD